MFWFLLATAFAQDTDSTVAKLNSAFVQDISGTNSEFWELVDVLYTEA